MVDMTAAMLSEAIRTVVLLEKDGIDRHLPPPGSRDDFIRRGQLRRDRRPVAF